MTYTRAYRGTLCTPKTLVSMRVRPLSVCRDGGADHCEEAPEGAPCPKWKSNVGGGGRPQGRALGSIEARGPSSGALAPTPCVPCRTRNTMALNQSPLLQPQGAPPAGSRGAGIVSHWGSTAGTACGPEHSSASSTAPRHRLSSRYGQLIDDIHRHRQPGHGDFNGIFSIRRQASS